VFTTQKRSRSGALCEKRSDLPIVFSSFDEAAERRREPQPSGSDLAFLTARRRRIDVAILYSHAGCIVLVVLSPFLATTDDFLEQVRTPSVPPLRRENSSGAIRWSFIGSERVTQLLEREREREREKLKMMRDRLRSKVKFKMKER